MPSPVTRSSRFISFPVGLLCLVAVNAARAQDATVLPQAQVGKPYSISIGVDTENGKGQLTWRLAQGDLPPGLQLSANGKIEGTPTDAKGDPYIFDLNVSDSSQPPQSAVLRFSVGVAAAALRIKGVKVAATQLKVVGVRAVEGASIAALSTDSGGTLASPTPSANTATPVPGSGPRPSNLNTALHNEPQGGGGGVGGGGAGNGDLPSDCKSTVPAYVTGSPVEALKVVTGCAGTTHHFAQVSVYGVGAAIGACPAAQAFPAPGTTRANVDVQTGVFHAELMSPVRTGQVICVWGVKDDNTLDAASPPLLVTDRTYEESDSAHGRIRYYFSAGVSFSQENQQFSNQSLFMGFNLDKNWLRHNWTHGSLVVNSYFDAQLTSIPVAANCQSVTTSSTPGSTSACPQTTSTSNDLQTFMTSRKAAVVQGGLYLPMYLNAWKWWYDGNRNELFIAPIIKGGYQTLTQGTQSVSSPTPGVTTTTATLSGQNLFPFYAYGIRLGHFTNYSSWNIAPELNSYLDLTIGRWDNFTQCQGGTCAVNTKQLFQPTTLDFEGHLKIPKTPFELGFSTFSPINGKSLIGDLRFYFGLRLDVGCIMNKILAGQNTTFVGCAASQGGTSAAAQ